MACVCGYTRLSQMARHKRSCKQFAIHVIEEKYKDSEAQCEKYRQENEQLRAEIGELKGRLEEARNARPNVNNVHNNVTINILPFGQEVPLSIEEVKPLMRIPSESVPRYIEMKHFRRPETANIRIPNKRGRTIQVVEEDRNGKRRRWVDKDRKELLSQLTDTSLDELLEHYNAGNDVMWNHWFKNSRLNDEGYDKTETFREIVRKVENVITSQRAQNVLCDEGVDEESEGEEEL